MRRVRSLGWTAVAALLTGAIGVQAAAQVVPGASAPPDGAGLADVVISPFVENLVRQLGSPDYRQRELATQRLQEEDGRIRLQLYAAFEQMSLSPEQRHRLLDVIRHRLLNAPSGALGISMQPRGHRDGGAIEVEVIDLIRGLPAEHVLEIGDRILAVDGEELHSNRDLVHAVQSKRPGEAVTLSIRRVQRDEVGRVKVDEQGKTVYRRLEVELVLGDFERLLDPSNGRDPMDGGVRDERRAEAEYAVRRFGPRPEEIRIRTGMSGTFNEIPVDPASLIEPR